MSASIDPDQTDGDWDRRTVRFAVALFVLCQLCIAFLFFSGRIREPYPALILPAFDQVLFDDSNTCVYVFPRFYVVDSEGKREPVDLPRGRLPTTPQKFLWTLARYAPPRGSEDVRPSLPSYDPRFGDPSDRKAFLQWVGTLFEEGLEEGESVILVWEERSSLLGGGAYEEVGSRELDTLQVVDGDSRG